MSFRRYPEYKDSGVAWLGDVPGHWETWKLSRAFSSIGSGTTPPSNESKWYEDGLVPWVTTGELRENVIFGTEKSVTTAALEQFPALRIHPSGSLVVAMYGATIGRLGILGVDATTNQACCVLSSPRSLDTRFVYFWLDGCKQTIINMYATGGGQPNISQDTIARLRIPAPHIEEQQTIAAFLDRETGKIDALVAEQERLIALLKEKRQAVISHAVTKGLNPDAPMKDSGIEWLGEVPEHWEVKKLGFLCDKIGSGKTPLGGAEIYADNGVLFLRSQNVYDDGLHLDDVVYIGEEIDAEMAWSRVRPGDILLNITGASLGRSCLVPNDFQLANVNQHVCIIRLIDASLQNYVAMVMKSSCTKSQMNTAQTGAAREGLNYGQISKLIIAVPPIDERQKISAFLERETTKLDALTAEATRAIELLQERRSALISAAVTGKIDVRGHVAAAATQEVRVGEFA